MSEVVGGSSSANSAVCEEEGNKDSDMQNLLWVTGSTWLTVSNHGSH